MTSIYHLSNRTPSRWGKQKGFEWPTDESGDFGKQMNLPLVPAAAVLPPPPRRGLVGPSSSSAASAAGAGGSSSVASGLQPRDNNSISGNSGKNPSFVTRSSCTWEVLMAPSKKQTLSARLMPTLRGWMPHKQRRISIEIRGPIRKSDLLNNPQSNLLATTSSEDVLRDRDMVVLCIYCLKKRKKDDVNTNISSNNSFANASENDYIGDESIQGALDDDDGSVAHGGSNDKDLVWVQRAQYKLEEVRIKKLSGCECEMLLGSGNDAVIREIKFESTADAEFFETSLQKVERLEKERSERQMLTFTKRIAMMQKATNRAWSVGSLCSQDSDAAATLTSIDLLIEVVGAVNLPVNELYSTDAYVIVRMGGKEIHRTGVIPKKVDPIWTLENGSLFLLQMLPEEFFACTGGMTFTVKDYDTLGSNPVLGQVTVPLNQLLQGNGDRIAFDLENNTKHKRRQTKKHDVESKLHLRFKPASESDIEFMTKLRENPKRSEVYLSETYLPLRHPVSKLLRGQKKKDKDGRELFRVKPFPDPARVLKTKWMTKQQIHEEAQKPSTHWIEAGSGSIAKVYFELIGCDDLPNMDAATLNMNDKTDAFACIAFEDSIVHSDVISDTLSPRWMPWCYRAFVFNMEHPSSDLFLAIFDYDPETSPAQLLSRTTSDLHDQVGRVRINLEKLRPNTVYNLTYPLILGGETDKHHKLKRGFVHVRLRIECHNPRKALLAGILPPKQIYTSMSRKVDFEVAHYTLDGKRGGENSFSMARFVEYFEELYSYKKMEPYFVKAALSIVLWKGHYKVKIFGRNVFLPLHSLTAYIWGILVTWNYNLLPSFLLFSIAWILLATNEWKRNDPSRWRQSFGYIALLQLLLFNRSPPEFIRSNECLEEITAYNEEMKRAEEEWERRTKEKRDERRAMNKDIRGQLNEVREDLDLATAKGGILKVGVTVNPLNSALFPVQRRLRKMVIWSRVARSIILWEETYMAFWLVTLALMASVVAYFIPWGFLLRWTFRIVIWIFLGPWMAVLDRKVLKIDLKDFDNFDSDYAMWQMKISKIGRKAIKKRVSKEHAVKLEAMMRYCYGKFVVGIPRFKEVLHCHHPLPVSFALPHDPSSPLANVKIVEKKFGQKLSGEMVMKREIQVDADPIIDLPQQVEKPSGGKRRPKPHKDAEPKLATKNKESERVESGRLPKKNPIVLEQSLPSIQNSESPPDECLECPYCKAKRAARPNPNPPPILTTTPADDTTSTTTGDENPPLEQLSSNSEETVPASSPTPMTSARKTSGDFSRLSTNPRDCTTQGGWVAVGDTRRYLVALQRIQKQQQVVHS